MESATPPADDILAGSAAADVRASHADRERVAAVLHAAAGHGQLALDEVDERLAAAYAARFRSELGPLTADLSAGPADDRPPGWPAVRSAAALQLHSSLTAAAERHRGVRTVLTHPWIAAAVAVVVLLAMFVLAARLGFDLD